jgi:hypothetical protein
VHGAPIGGGPGPWAAHIAQREQAAAAAVPGTSSSSSSSYPQHQVGVHQQPLHRVAPPALGWRHTGGGYAAAASAASMVTTGMSSAPLPLPPPPQQQQQQRRWHWDHPAADVAAPPRITGLETLSGLDSQVTLAPSAPLPPPPPVRPRVCV